LNIAKSKKTHSTRFLLIVPTTVLFIVFDIALSIVAFFVYSNNVTTLTMNQVNTMSQQVLSNYNTYFESAILVSDNIQIEVDNLDLNNVTSKATVRKYFDDTLTFKEEINHISLYSITGDFLTSNTKYVPPQSSVTTADWFSRAYSNPLINIFSRVDGTGGAYYFTLSKYINTNKGDSNAILRISFDFSKILNLISSTDLGNGGHVSIYDNYYGIVYTSSSSINDNETNLVKSLVMGIKPVKLDTDYILYVSTISQTSWRVAIFTNNEGLSITLRNFIITISLLATAIAIIFAFVMWMVSNSITKPIRTLQQEMIKVEGLNYVVGSDNLVMHGSQEVIDLQNSFNQMMARIKELMNKVIEEQDEQRKSELKALQNQINPHFLYNTFDSIIYMIDEGKNDEAEEMIVALSKFFRISVSKGHNIIPLESEIDHAKYYLTIQKLRFGDSFEYKFNIDQKLYKYYVIKLILQPIIENAIGHGIKESPSDKNLILINGYEENGLIKLEVIDNGYGILPEKVQEIYDSFHDKNIHNGVGLKNVYERIRIYYGEKADLKIESILDSGTKITIIIPVEGALKNEEK
jgi:Predicted signal transduction protein with a C-terminal ATPase domain